MKIAKIIGLLVILFSTMFSVFYVLWFFGFLPIDSELAVKIPVLVIVLGACFVAAWIGYIMLTAPGPLSLGSRNLKTLTASSFVDCLITLL